MWTGSLGILYRYWTRPPSAPDDLLTFVRQVPHEPLEAAYVAPMRFPTVLLMSLFVVAFYALLSRLFDDRRVGVVAALLLALNPFHVALSRVLHHDALATAFMTLSLLPLLGYWLRGWSRRWLLLSGVAAGLSFLSKSPAMFLMPFCALLGLGWAVRRWRQGMWGGWPDVGRLVVDGLLWGGVAWLTVFLLWPAMWNIPLKVLGVVFGTGSQYVTEGHGKGNFFLGQSVHDPGPLFYPLSWLLRTTPLVLLGLLGWAIFYLHNVFNRRGEREASTGTLVGMLVLYALLFAAFMTWAEKKADRYILPVYPVLDALAALGLAQVSNIPGLPSRAGKYQISNGKYQIPNINYQILFAIILLFQGILVAVNYPYYYTYYNPLLGGAPTAARLVLVGWGEGLDRAAVYLNDLPEAEKLRVTAWYHYSFGPFFRGEATYYASDAGQTMSSDYAVVYRNQIQRELPTPELVDYLLQHHTPVFTATLQGLDYVYVYHLPMARRSDWQTSRLPGRAVFFGLGESETDAEALWLRLYWQNEGLAPDEGWWVALGSVAGSTQPWEACGLRPGFADERLMAGALLESECRLTGEGLSPGAYHLRVGVGPDADQVTPITFPAGEFTITVEGDGPPRLVSRLAALDVLARQSLPGEAHPADLVYQGVVRLIGYRMESVSTDGGHHLRVDLYWQALEPLPLAELNQALAVEMALVSPQGTALGSVQGPFVDPETSPAVWPAGHMLAGTLSLPLPDSVPSASQLKLDVWLGDQRLTPLHSSGEAAEATLPVSVLQ
jgi:hypothetical protein